MKKIAYTGCIGVIGIISTEFGIIGVLHYTMLGRIENTSGLTAALGTGRVTVTFAL